MKLAHGIGTFCVALCITVFFAGCSQQETSKGSDKQVAKKKSGGTPKVIDDHSGWWCPAHGIPEDRCSLCLPDAEVEKRFVAKGDWCELHDRAKSQCFKCDPKLYDRFAAIYRAKFFGKEPPRPPEEEFQK